MPRSIPMPPTRFAGCSAWTSRATLLAFALLVAAGLGRSLPNDAVSDLFAPAPVETPRSDADLYRAVAGRVAAGEAYYPVVVAEHQAGGYPVHPFVAVRMPALAELTAALGPSGAQVLLGGLALLAWMALRRRCAASVGDPRLVPIASVLAAAGLAPLFNPMFAPWHEAWAGCLIALSLGLRTPERWRAAVLAGLCAAAVRELALPYLAVMALFAVLEGRRGEAAGWLAAILGAALLLALHASMLAPHAADIDMHSPGWLAAGGWGFILSMMATGSLLVMIPAPLVATLVPLCLLGWLASPGPFGARGALTLCGYVLAFTVVGRPDNAYWGLILAPLLFMGLAYAPAAIRDLSAAALPRGRSIKRAGDEPTTGKDDRRSEARLV